jgi:two-component system response regulator FixJ
MESACVYVVDDDRTIRSSMLFLLRSHGLGCRAFAGGDELIGALDGLAPGCILLDMRLRGRSGLEVQAELIRRGSRLPVIAMTGDTDVGNAERAVARGAVGMLEKPFDDEALMAALKVGFEALEKA